MPEIKSRFKITSYRQGVYGKLTRGKVLLKINGEPALDLNVQKTAYLLNFYKKELVRKLLKSFLKTLDFREIAKI